MNERAAVLGIDTSNYRTSVAIVDRDGHIVCDERILLTVRSGERGLRQSDALFQHIGCLPSLIEKVMGKYDGGISAVACSTRPRPVEGSYMPVFLAGESTGRSLAAALGVPLLRYSHQEGHIEAVRAYSPWKEKKHFIACHFSGGTCEVLEVTEANEVGYKIDIVGGSRDISLGQVLDRAGVALGLEFPAGQAMDEMARRGAAGSARSTPGGTRYEEMRLTKIRAKDGWINLSGIETQIKQRIESFGLAEIMSAYGMNENSSPSVPGDKLAQAEALAAEIFSRFEEAIVWMLKQSCDKTGLSCVLLAGGVSSSLMLRQGITDRLRDFGIEVVFGSGELSQDNAVGVALLGRKEIWD